MGEGGSSLLSPLGSLLSPMGAPWSSVTVTGGSGAACQAAVALGIAGSQVLDSSAAARAAVLAALGPPVVHSAARLLLPELPASTQSLAGPTTAAAAAITRWHPGQLCILGTRLPQQHPALWGA
mmetsp:Transcript_17000/g.42563  ORF Transcript_17000/g.42563 Transcript_17000/m.42563 type:complete len:124 (+) Transcript_17000:5421-5792(+)